MLKISILSVLLGFTAYGIAVSSGINARNIPGLEAMMSTAIALGLYINVLSIDKSLFKSNLGTISRVLLLGVPIKIVVPGFILSCFLPKISLISYLCATVIAQIDPVVAAKFTDSTKLSKKSETILRAWSSFDDPITLLFAFYIFLPMVSVKNVTFLTYILKIFTDILICFAAYFLYKLAKKNLNKLYDNIIFCLELVYLVIVIILSVLFQSFLLPAFLGTFIRPIAPEKLQPVISAIFYFSVIVIGLLSANLSLNWVSGGILALSMFFLAQVIVTLIFLKDSFVNKLRVMFGHQNGMTAILLTIAIEIDSSNSTKDLLSITLPAIIIVALFYFASNYILDRTSLIRKPNSYLYN